MAAQGGSAGSRLDAVVIGAGLAGLSAARRLVAAGATVAVAEARDRPGGRTFTEPLDGVPVDLGGQWIGPGQERMIALAASLGLETFPTFDKGRTVLVAGGRRSTYAGAIPSMAPHRLALLQATISRVDAAAKRVPLADPWRARGARRLDATTVEAWKRRNVPSAEVAAVFDVAVRTVFGAEPAELSMLHFLFYVNAGGGLMRLVEIRGGAQERRFAGGAQSVANALCAELGDRVLLGHPVVRVEQNERGVAVKAGRRTLRAREAIVAVPPAVAGRIAFDPPLSAARDALLQRVPMGATIKSHALFERPFWRDDGLSGEAVITRGPVSVVFDNSGPESPPSLLAFSVGAPARRLGAMAPEDRRAAVTEALVGAFGPEAKSAVAWRDYDWSADPWTRGCPTGFFPPGVLSMLGPALRRPEGRIHWAGTETATEWAGYMDGAVQSGERAAAEVLSRLS